jgi:hypothetical protein
MTEFLIVLVIAFGLFGLLAAAIALRARRHPAAGCGGQGCACQGRKIQCFDRLPQRDGMDDAV